MRRILPTRASISIENDIDERHTVNGPFRPVIRSRRTTIEFKALIDESTFRKHPMHDREIEVQLDETIHTVVLEHYDIKYAADYGRKTCITASGVVVDSREIDDHPLKRAVDKAVRENQP
jgi:hypothetical protein